MAVRHSKSQKHDWLISTGYVEGELPVDAGSVRVSRTGYNIFSKLLRGSVKPYLASPSDIIASDQARWSGVICLLHKTVEEESSQIDNSQTVGVCGSGLISLKQVILALYAASMGCGPGRSEAFAIGRVVATQKQEPW